MRVVPARFRQDTVFRHFPVQPWLEVGKGHSEISIPVKQCPERALDIFSVFWWLWEFKPC